VPLALALGGCDIAQPAPPPAGGPPVHVVAMYPQDGCGVGADPDCMPVPRNATITLRFDRWLNPATVNRQAILVYTGDPKFSPSVTYDVNYDPVERVVEFRVPPGSAGYEPQTLYEVELRVAKTDTDFGIRAFDGAPLAAGDIALHTRFETGTDYVDHPVTAAPDCTTIWQQVFQQLGDCAGVACHNTGFHRLGSQVLADAPYGLRLDGADALLETAISHIARETDLGDYSGGVPTAHGPRFGVRMPLIDGEGRSPGNSYLLYKLFLDRDNFEPCAGTSPTVCATPASLDTSIHADLPLGSGELLLPPDNELVRLREWFVRGDGMPRLRYDDMGNSLQGRVTLQGLRALAGFIAAGADCSSGQAASGGAGGAAGSTSPEAGAGGSVPEAGAGGAGG
jgi:hypothetical protein